MYENETYEQILERVLDRMPEGLDKRESSFLFNASAPNAMELANAYIALDNILNLTFYDTSDRGGKLERCKERGINIEQFDATKSVVKIEVTPTDADVQVGSRFNMNNLNFIVLEQIGDGVYKAECEMAGTDGNATGDIIPIDYIYRLEKATITEVLEYGSDEKDVEEIDKIYYASLKAQAFGGNKMDYYLKVYEYFPRAAGVKVYTADEWRGGGTVRLVFSTKDQDGKYVSPEPIDVLNLQNEIDPTPQASGLGLAPIGHTVTVDGVISAKVNIETKLTLQTGYIYDDIKWQIEKVVDEYFDELNKDWEKTGTVGIEVKLVQIQARIIDIEGVLDVYDTKINGLPKNYNLDKDALAVRGEINART